jgi:hypothetical protein
MPSEETVSLTDVHESNEAGLGQQPRSTTGNLLEHSPSQGLGESNARPDDKAENPASGTPGPDTLGKALDAWKSPEVEDHPDGDEIRRQVRKIQHLLKHLEHFSKIKAHISRVI